MQKSRIAVVSTDSVNVDEHFGKAHRFLIYDIDDQMTFVEERQTEMLSDNDPNHDFNSDKMARTLSCLSDCCKVYVTRIGEKPATSLKQKGIEAVVFSGPIADIA